MAAGYWILAIIALVVPPIAPAMNLNPTYGQQNTHSNKLFQLFDMELLKKLDKRSNGNILVSPMSVKQVLAMILEGAEGDSAHELTVAINSLSNKDDIKYIFKDILQHLSRDQPGVEFENANHIFVSDKVTPKRKYQETLQNYYSSGIASVDFNDPYATSNKINSWVQNVTRGLIPSLVSPDTIKASSSIILANALFFKGVWEKSFNKEATIRACFYNTPKNCYHTYMMDASETYNYAEWKVNEFEVKALEIPYKDNQFSMMILLPNKNSFSRMMHNLPIIYPDIVKNLQMTEVLATLPRFSIDYSEDIARVLEEMDIREIFSQEKANLSRMVEGRNDLYVSNVLHKAKIDVNEEGTIAAASTGAVVIPLMGNTKPMFRADHPFVFVVRHVQTGAILFSGRVTEPEYAPEPAEYTSQAPMQFPEPPALHIPQKPKPDPDQGRQYQTQNQGSVQQNIRRPVYQQQPNVQYVQPQEIYSDTYKPVVDYNEQQATRPQQTVQRRQPQEWATRKQVPVSENKRQETLKPQPDAIQFQNPVPDTRSYQQDQSGSAQYAQQKYYDAQHAELVYAQ